MSVREIIYEPQFKFQRQFIFDFIKTRDGKARADKFDIELMAKVNSVNFMPFSHRKSVINDDENTRDLIFKGYVVPFHITDKTIQILGIFKENLW